MNRVRDAEVYGLHLAHLGKTGNQLLSDHLSGVAGQCSELAKKLGLEKAGELIGLLHDLGKATKTFQDYLLSFASDGEARDDLRGKIDHSTAGAQCLLANIHGAQQEDSIQGIVARFLAICIASHHSGLIDCLEPDGDDKLNQRLKKSDHDTRFAEAWTNLYPPVKSRAEALMQDPGLVAEVRNAIASLTTAHDKGEGDMYVQVGLLLRLLFSCLIDADRTNTANFEKPAAAVHRQDQSYETWEKLLEHLDRNLSQMNTDGFVNGIRRQVSDECFRAAARLGGIYTLTVLTGGGKTLSALRFALEHARRHALDRIIFVSPYISIVDQNAAVARSILEPEGVPYASVVLEHHSNVQDDPNDEVGRPDLWRRRVLAENWDAPVVFTTSVQVLETLFGSGTRAVRRLHAMARAVIVFDEVQTLPIKMVHLFNNAINLLASHCGSTVVLCTATQRLLETVCKAKGAARLGNPPGLVSNPQQLFEQLKRYEVFDHTDRPEGWQIAHVAELALTEAQKYGSCLAIMNTKKDARELFQSLREQAGANALVVHLSTGMCPAHRVEKLEELCGQLPNATGEQPVICVSTQLIEAGVDIDFACVIRDLAGLDSITQAAGRCNRHGARSNSGRVHIVELPEPPAQLDEIRQGRTVARELLGQWRRANPGRLFPLDDPQQMTEYYSRTFYRRKDEMSYSVGPAGIGRSTSLLELLGANGQAKNDAVKSSRTLHRSLLLQSFQTANNAFALIANTQGIVVPYSDEGRGIVNQLSAVFDLESEWQLLRKAQRFTLSVYASRFKKLEKTARFMRSGGAQEHTASIPSFMILHSGYGSRPALWRISLPETFATPKNCLEFRVWGRYALFTDPLTRVGGEKSSYHLPTYEALKGICKSIYWKPTFIWYVDKVRVLRRIRTQTRGMKPLDYISGGNTLAIYTYLTGDARSENPVDITDGPGVEYQVRAHFEWNPHHAALAGDRMDGKHYAIARRSLERGGRQDIFLGTRDCQGYVAPCRFGEGPSDYDNDGSLDYGLTFHSFDYPDETGAGRLGANFWRPKLVNGVLAFPRPDDASQIVKKDIRAMQPRAFGVDRVRSVEAEAAELAAATGALDQEAAS